MNEYDFIYDPENHDFEPDPPYIVELDDRQRLLFAPLAEQPAPEQAVDNYDYLYDSEWEGATETRSAAVAVSDLSRSPTDESLQAAKTLMSGRMDQKVQEIIRKISPESAISEDKVSVVRQNPLLREALAGYFLGKIPRMSDLPDRVLRNGEKSTKVPGYAQQKMPSQEYVALLALSMLDGSFKGDGGDEIRTYGKGVAEQGQHRFAARRLLEPMYLT